MNISKNCGIPVTLEYRIWMLRLMMLLFLVILCVNLLRNLGTYVVAHYVNC